MRRITDYFYAIGREGEVLIDPETYEGEFRLVGKYEGEILATSAVKNIEGNVVTTNSGSKYELVNINPDYVDYLKAIKEGIPVIEEWNIVDLVFCYEIRGKVNGEKVKLPIASQEGNYLIMQDGTKYFVNWKNLSELVEFEICFHGKTAFLNYEEDFIEFANMKSKPILNFDEFKTKKSS